MEAYSITNPEPDSHVSKYLERVVSGEQRGRRTITRAPSSRIYVPAVNLRATGWRN